MRWKMRWKMSSENALENALVPPTPILLAFFVFYLLWAIFASIALNKLFVGHASEFLGEKADHLFYAVGIFPDFYEVNSMLR